MHLCYRAFLFSPRLNPCLCHVLTFNLVSWIFTLCLFCLIKWHCHSSEKEPTHNTLHTRLSDIASISEKPIWKQCLIHLLLHIGRIIQHAALCIDCMIEIPIIANPSVSDPMFNQEQSLEHSNGCMTSMLAIVVLGFHQDSIACISSVWAMVGRDRRDKWGKE